MKVFVLRGAPESQAARIPEPKKLERGEGHLGRVEVKAERASRRRLHFS